MSASARRLQIRRIYEPVQDTDGARVLVDRLWPRGITKERARLSLWLKDIAPSPALRKWFHHDPERWPEFQRKYRAELDRNEAVVQQLLELAAKDTVTLLYAAHDPAHNQAVALLEYLEARMHAK